MFFKIGMVPLPQDDVARNSQDDERPEATEDVDAPVTTPNTVRRDVIEVKKELIVSEVQSTEVEALGAQKSATILQRRLDHLYALRVEQERNRLVQKYFGINSETGLFNRFVVEPAPSQRLSIEVKVSVSTG